MYTYCTISLCTFSIGQGKLLGVTGKVGSGKSSLLAAITAEMRRIQGQVLSHTLTCIVFMACTVRMLHVCTYLYSVGFYWQPRWGGWTCYSGNISPYMNWLYMYVHYMYACVLWTVHTHYMYACIFQEAWIQQATVQSNILFGRDMQPGFYQQVIAACALQEVTEIYMCVHYCLTCTLVSLVNVQYMCM